MGKVIFTPDNWTEGGGLWGNIDARFTNCRYESAWTASGKRQASPAFVSDLVNLEGEGETIEGGWTLGSDKNFQASKDGVKKAEVGDYVIGGPPTKSSNYVILVASLIEALPDAEKEEKIKSILGEGKASAWDGLEAHIVRKTVERENLEKKKRPGGGEYDFTVPVIDSILKFPGEKKQKAQKASAAAAPDSDMDKLAIMKVVEVLKAKGSLSRTALAQACFDATTDTKMKQPLGKLIYASKWLEDNAAAGGWTYDAKDETVALAEGGAVEKMPWE